MSKLLQIWKNKALIAEGIKNNLFKQEDIEKVHQHRMKICQGCDFLDKEGSDCIFPGTQPCCKSCGCSLAIKTRSMAAYCPEGLWESVLTPEQEDKLNDTLSNQ